MMQGLVIHSPRRTFGWGAVGTLSIAVIGEGLDDGEWHAGITQAVEATSARYYPLNLTVAMHTFPSHRQRRGMRQVLEANGLPPAQAMALVTSSRLVIGAATAVAAVWKQLHWRAFSPGDLDAAWRWLASQNAFDLEDAKRTLAAIDAGMAQPALQGWPGA
jgi:hypothetical protein